MTYLDPGQFATAPEPTWGDYGSVIKSGMYQGAAGLAALGRRASYSGGDYANQVGFEQWQQYLQGKRDEADQGLSDAAKLSLSSDFGSEEFWSRPGQWAILRTLNTVPSTAATIAPLALIGGAAGLGAAGATGGGLEAGSIYQNIYETIDGMDDAELAKASPQFAADVKAGKSSVQAREDLVAAASDNPALWAFVSGAAASMIGPEAALGSALGRFVGKGALERVEGGFVKGALKEAAIGVATEGPQEAFQQYQQELANVNAGLQTEVDPNRVAQAGYAGSVIGGILGGAAGGVERFGKGGEAKPSTAPPPPDVQAKTEPYARKSAIPDTTPPPTTAPFPGAPVGQQGAIPVTPYTPRPLGQVDPNAPSARRPGDFLGPRPPPRDPRGPTLDPRAPPPETVPTGPLAPVASASTITPDTAGALSTLGRNDTLNLNRTVQSGFRDFAARNAPTTVNALGPDPAQQVALKGAIPDSTLPATLPFDLPGGPDPATPPVSPAPVAPQPTAGAGVQPPVSAGTPPAGPPTPGAVTRPTGPLSLKQPRTAPITPPETGVRFKGGVREGTPPAPVTTQTLVERPAGPNQFLEQSRAVGEPISYAEAVQMAEAAGWKGPYSKRVDGRVRSEGWRPVAGKLSKPASSTTEETTTPTKKQKPDFKTLRVSREDVEARRRQEEAKETFAQREHRESLEEANRALEAPLPEETAKPPKGRKKPYTLASIALPAEPGETELKNWEEPGYTSAKRRAQRIGTKTNKILEKNLARTKKIEEEKRVAEEHAATGKKPGQQYTGKIGKSAIAQRTEGNKVARELLSRSPVHLQQITSPKQRQRLFDRLEAIVKEAEQRGIEIKDRVTEKMADGVAYLVTAKELLYNERYGKGATDREISDFLTDEHDARNGNFDTLRQRRKAGASERVGTQLQEAEPTPEDIVSGEEERGVEQVPLAAETPAKVSGHKRGPVRGVGTEGAASEGRHVPVTPEEAAKYGATVHPKANQIKEVAKSRQAKLKEAEAQIDKTATQAEREAGVAKVGHYNVDGMRLSITHAKGDERLGVPSPAAYGYAIGSESPDGEQVDVYVGPDMDSDYKVYVIYQQDPDTQVYDEPKAMLGFNSMAAAGKTYASAFSDGKGLQRIKDIRVMSRDEFKAWLNSPDTKAPPEQSVVNVRKQGVSYIVTVNNKKAMNEVFYSREAAVAAAANYADQNVGMVMHPSLTPDETLGLPIEEKAPVPNDGFGSAEAFLTYHGYEPTTVSELDFNQLLAEGHFDPSMRRGLQAIWDKISPHAKNVPVYYISSEHMDKLGQGRKLGGGYSSKENLIIFDRGYTPDNPRTVLHEVVHAAFVKTMVERPEIRRLVDTIAREYAASGARKGYEFKNSDEFIAEAFSKGTLQRDLMGVQASPRLRSIIQARRGDGIVSQAMSLWDAIRHTIADVFKFKGRTQDSLLDAVMHVGQMLEETTTSQGPLTNMQSFERMMHHIAEQRRPGSPWVGNIESTLGLPRLPEALRGPEGIEQENAPWLVRYRGSNSLAQRASDLGANFGKQARALTNNSERQRVDSQEIGKESDPFLRQLAQAANKYRGAQWHEFAKLTNDTTVAEMDPSRPAADQVPNTVHYAWSREQYDDLRQRYLALPDELKDVFKSYLNHYTEQQNKLNRMVLHNTLVAGAADNPGLEQRLFEGTETEQDKAFLGADFYNQIKDVNELSRLNAYTPQMRHGDHAVVATTDIKPPTNATRQLSDDEGNPIPIWEFDTEAKAEAFAKKQDTPSKVRSIYVDEAGNSALKAQEGAVPRWRVSVQNKHVDFFETLREANAAALELQNQGWNVKYAGVREFDPNNIQTELLSTQMRRMVRGLRNRDSYKNLSENQRNEVLRALIEQSTRLMGATRIQSRRLPRNNVLGASLDLVKNASVYTKSMAGYMSKLKHQPETDRAIAALEAAIRDPSDSSKVNWNARQVLANELIQRATDAFKYDPRQGKIMNAVGSAAFLRFLASPAYTAIQLLQPTMLTLPRLIARYGVGRAVRMMYRVYSDVDARNILKQGVLETGRQFKGGPEYQFFNSAVQSLSGRERQAMEALYKLGVFGIDAGMDVERGVALEPGRFTGGLGSAASFAAGKVQQGLDYANSIARALPRSAETVNRFVSALSSYRLEMERNGGDHDAAVQFAQDVTNATQGLYSHTDAPPMFKHPLMKFPLLFRRYASLVYDHLGLQVGRMLNSELDPAVRMEALKTFALTLGAHAVMAGVLGLPTEPIKAALLALNALGFDAYTPADLENLEREAATALLGQFGGEVFSRGLPHALGFDLSTRVGLNDMLLPPGEIDVQNPDNVYKTIGELAGGAPVSMGLDAFAGLRSLWGGDYADAAQRMIPVKGIQDAIKAWRYNYEGKQSAAGYESMKPYGAGEAAFRALGLTPSRETETSERRQYYFNRKQRDDAERNDFMHAYQKAKPSDRFRVWRDVQKWNKSQPDSRRLTMKDLEAYRKRRASQKVEDGFIIDKTSRDLFERTKATYNVQ